MQARRRRPVATLAAAAALLGLTGCEKPAPSVTLYSGGTSLHDEAVTYCFPGQDPAKAAGTASGCRSTGTGQPRKALQVHPGDQVVVDVDRELVDTGWRVALLAGQPPRESRSGVQQRHDFSFSTDFSQAPTQILEVQQLASPRDDAQVVGRWRFALAPEV